MAANQNGFTYVPCMVCSPCSVEVFAHCNNNQKVRTNSPEAALFAAKLEARKPFWEAVERRKEEMAKQYGGHKNHYHIHALHHVVLSGY
uniref:Uncharacterized protein n=1 Tax=viral metagenome TaxID=1070528 RepID=A0A6C0B1W0_9ZZZZ